MKTYNTVRIELGTIEAISKKHALGILENYGSYVNFSDEDVVDTKDEFFKNLSVEKQIMAKTEAFRIDWQWNFYLEAASVTERNLSKKELEEMKETFYAAFAQCVYLFTEGIKTMDHDTAVPLISQLAIEAEEYFTK